MNFHIHVDKTDTKTQVAIADEDGIIIAVNEFFDRHDSKGSRDFRAMAWTMGILIRQVSPESQIKWNGN